MPKKAKQPKRRPLLLVSFIGRNDLNNVGKDGRNGPLLSSINYLTAELGFGELGDRAILLNDCPFDDQRELYTKALRARLEATQNSATIELVTLSGVNGDPTNLNILFKGAFQAIPSGPTYETLFLVSSGTPAMYATLILAAEYLKLDRPRVFQSSLEKRTEEIFLPYQLGLRPRPRKLDKQPNAIGGNLPIPGGLMPDTLLSDPNVIRTYTNLAERRHFKDGLLIYGPAGSGKHHAARQLAYWQGCTTPVELRADSAIEAKDLPESGVVIVSEAQAVANDVWQVWRGLMRQKPMVQFVFLWRETTESTSHMKAVDAGLAPGGYFHLPGFAERDDIVSLAGAFARQVGKREGKVKERVQYALMKHEPVQTLHGLKAWITSLAAASSGVDLDETAVERGVLQTQAERAREHLVALSALLVSQEYLGLCSLDTLLDAILVLSVDVQRGFGDTNERVAQRLGFKRTTLFNERLPRARASLATLLGRLETGPSDSAQSLMEPKSER